MKSHCPQREILSGSVSETLDLGDRIGQAIKPGQVIALAGGLGSGKTHLVKGIARGAGVPNQHLVNSPTFVLVNEYDGRIHLYHLDVYRLRGSDDLDAIGFDEMIASGGAVIVEWADRVAENLPADHLRVDIQITGETDRSFTLRATGQLSGVLLASLA